MKKVLQQFRIVGGQPYTPNPYASDWCLIWMGVLIILNALRYLPRRLFNRIRVYVSRGHSHLQYRLVRHWTGHHNYDREMAKAAWFYTGYSLLGLVLLIRFLYSLL